MLIARNAKIHGLYVTLFVVISCSGVDLTIDANFQSAVASQLRRHVHDVVMAGDCPKYWGYWYWQFMLNSSRFVGKLTKGLSKSYQYSHFYRPGMRTGMSFRRMSLSYHKVAPFGSLHFKSDVCQGGVVFLLYGGVLEVN